jgi:hypothetical protein
MSDKNDESRGAVLLTDLLGRHILVGLTFDNGKDEVEPRREQFHGTVKWVDEKKGVGLELCGAWKGEVRVLPPFAPGYRLAKPGDYQLSGTGEIVTNPDFLATFRVSKASKAG